MQPSLYINFNSIVIAEIHMVSVQMIEVQQEMTASIRQHCGLDKLTIRNIFGVEITLLVQALNGMQGMS